MSFLQSSVMNLRQSSRILSTLFFRRLSSNNSFKNGDKETPTISPFANEDRLKSELDSSLSPEERLEPGQAEFSSPSTVTRRRKKRPLSNRPREYDDHESSVLLFPGQGSQFVGMGQDVLNTPVVQDMFAQASQILGYDILKLCLHGPKEELDRTIHCQPAVFVTSLAAVEKLYAAKPAAIERCQAAAGFSVGEITALVFAGAMSFEDGLKLISVRAEAMEEASRLEPSGMLSVFFGADAKLGLAVDVAKKWVQEKDGLENPVLNIANHLYGGAKVLAGHDKCLRFIEENRSDFGIRRVKRIPVSGAFHTALMEPALPAFVDALEKTQLTDPRIPVFSNIDGHPYKNVKEIRKNLPKQIVRAVKWEQSMTHVFRYSKSEYLPEVYECGPGQSLTAMLKKINGKVASQCTVVTV